MQLTNLGGYLLLVALAFLAPTPIPVPLDGIIIGLIAKHYNPLFVILVALVGDLLGTVLIYHLGVKGGKLLEKAAYKRQHPIYKTASGLYHRYGRYSLLLSGIPFMGDSLILLSGIFQLPANVFFPIFTLGKILWYAIVYGGILLPIAHFLR